MNKDLIKKKYKEKIKLYNFYNKKYFNENISEVSDAKFDLLKSEIINLENRYSFLKSKNSPQLQVGHKPSKNFKKEIHRVSMLSLSNAFTEEDLNNFEKKMMNYLDKKDNFQIEYSVEPKIDGI